MKKKACCCLQKLGSRASATSKFFACVGPNPSSSGEGPVRPVCVLLGLAELPRARPDLATKACSPSSRSGPPPPLLSDER